MNGSFTVCNNVLQQGEILLSWNPSGKAVGFASDDS
jgi:hypothetical protein